MTTKRKDRKARIKKDNDTYKRHIRGFRSVGASDTEMSKYRKVSARTYSDWIDFQRKVRKVGKLEDLDHRYARSRLNPRVRLDCLIAVNIINLAPMNRSENRSKGDKVVLELLHDQILVAKSFLSNARLSSHDRYMFSYLLRQYKNFVDEVSLELLVTSGILF